MPQRESTVDSGVFRKSGSAAFLKQAHETSSVPTLKAGVAVPIGTRLTRRTLPFGGVPALRIAMLYDMDACHGPTGVTRHALAQLERLAGRPDIALSLVTGRMTHPDGLAYWESLEQLAPSRTATAHPRYPPLVAIKPWPPIEWWTGPLDWVYSPAEYLVATRHARRAVTSHDVLQLLRFERPKRRLLLGQVFDQSDLILSVSHFNTDRLLEAFPKCRDRVAYVPNAADDLFFDPATNHEQARVHEDLGLPPQIPYLLSVANFQPRKNLLRLIHSAARLPEVSAGELALVLIGTGGDEEARPLREAAAAAGPRALIRMPGYRQGRALRAIYSRRRHWCFPRCARVSASRPSRRWHRASPSPWPTRPPCPKSAVRLAGTLIRPTKTP